ncbi:uncharacterized protein LOC143196716 isoform X2 [Rhynchophorus ferrugineus]|uniref:uncharacterized protein LOC143196716 isoform X2 n=1 Tax=Rhynchophorus ferrugineus TaxID=354439 RepID=UPI003FCC6F0E
MERHEKGENSRKNDDIDEEKPLKKARYVWEVKGKHHMRHSSGILSDASSSSKDDQACWFDESHKKGPTQINSTQNCCLKTFLAKTEDIMDRDSSDEDDSQKFPLESSIENEIPVTLVSVQPKNQDYYLRKWQARQIARGFVDNTINSMLENWVDRPFDAAHFVEDCENDGQVEDDAILMAIQSHGLQSGWRTNMSNSSNISSNISNSSKSGSITLESTCDNYENLQKEQENESSVASTSSSMSIDTVSSISNHYEEDLGDPMNFLNAAVTVAIQKKGLTYGCPSNILKNY